MINRTLASLLALAGMSMPIMADEPKTPANSEQASSATLKTTPDPLPEGMSRFNGMLVGRLAAKDVEQGTFVLQVDAVPRVWENSKAENPQSIAGKTVKVSGVFGKFLDVLVVTRVGDTLEFECKHDGEGLVFPGEMLRKVAAFDPTDYPVLPKEFRGFRGQVSAVILKKDPETFELIIRVNRVLKAWEGSSAKNPKSIEGKSLTLAGFWNRRDAYHAFKVGDKIEVGMRHGGQIIGATDEKAEGPAHTGYSPDDLAATFLTNIGIDPKREYLANVGRPITVIRDGNVIPGILNAS